MRAVRREDRYCRVPQCGCGRMQLTLEVAHAGELGHRKMGGDKALMTTVPENLLLACRPRHRAHRFAIDKKTLKPLALTERGLRGPVQWLVDVSIAELVAKPADWAPNWAELVRFHGGRPWYLLATEIRPHVCEPFTAAQQAMLDALAAMTI